MKPSLKMLYALLAILFISSCDNKSVNNTEIDLSSRVTIVDNTPKRTASKQKKQEESTILEQTTNQSQTTIPISKSEKYFKNVDKNPVFDFNGEFKNVNQYFNENMEVPASFLAKGDTISLIMILMVDKHKKLLADSTQFIKLEDSKKYKGKKTSKSLSSKEFAEHFELGEEFMIDLKKNLSQIPFKEAAVHNGEYVNAIYVQMGVSLPFMNKKYMKFN